MIPSPYPHLPVLMVDDEIQTLNSFDFVLRSASMTHLIRCQDSRKVPPGLLSSSPRRGGAWAGRCEQRKALGSTAANPV
jgi:hypothetical protein